MSDIKANASVVVTPIDRCANLECPNLPHEGRMAVVQSISQVVGGHRGLTLVLCSPCASGLTAVCK